MVYDMLQAIFHKHSEKNFQNQSTHPLKNDIQLCIFDLLDEGSESNRGGLTRVNNLTYELLVAMELELRRHVRNFEAPNVKMINAAILENEDLIFCGVLSVQTGIRVVLWPC